MVDDVYNPITLDTDGQTPTLDVVIQAFIDAAMRECRVWLPVTVIAVIPAPTLQVSVQPTLLRTFPQLPIPVPIPPLQNLPVIYPRGNAYGVKLPVAIGDPGIALFCDRSLDIWKAQPVPIPVDPESQRVHDLSDGVFIPGLFPLLAPPAPAATTAGPLDLALYNGLAQLFLQPAGTFIQGNGVIDNFTALVALSTALSTMATAAAAGFTAQATASTGSLSPLQPGFTALAATFTAAAVSFSLAVTEFTALKGIPGA